MGDVCMSGPMELTRGIPRNWRYRCLSAAMGVGAGHRTQVPCKNKGSFDGSLGQLFSPLTFFEV